ncbi:MAG: NUDIX hydrolase [Parachlamydiaceae bacterium]|nr:NUDIX hydrolase [Parachlamydiaceae bacterium]
MDELSNRSRYPISVDSIIFGYTDRRLKVALIQRKKVPFRGMWAIPGGFMENDETVEDTAFRELEEETGIRDVYLEEFGVFSKRGRDPRGPTITVAFFALIDSTQCKLTATADAEVAQWWPAYEIPDLAFDHNEIYNKALTALRIALKTKPIAFKLLPKEFTLTELQNLYEQVFAVTLDKRNFRKKALEIESIVATKNKTAGHRQRPALLYRYDSSASGENTQGLSF